MHTRTPFGLKGTCCLVVCSMAIASSAVTVGPRLDTAPVGAKKVTTKLDIPDLSMVIPVLDADIPTNVDEQQKKGIWPELRETEAVRCALHISEAIKKLNQFDSVLVTPDASASADLYLLGEIKESNGEILAIRYQVVDATGTRWFGPQTTKHRVSVGWHARYERTGADPFGPLYDEIAANVYELLKAKAKQHNDQTKRRRDSSRLSDLEKVTVVRDLVYASYISPDQYGDVLKEKDGIVSIAYMPQLQSDDWARIESIGRREETFTNVLDGMYVGFVDEIDESYRQWQKDSLPIAREMRIARRNARIEGIAGWAAILLAAHAATGGGGMDRKKALDVAQAATVVGGGLLTASFIANQNRKDAVRQINEMGRSMNDAFRPTRVDLNGRIVTLDGTAHEQFAKWRQLLGELYQNQESDVDAVAILEDTTPSESQ